MRIPCVLSNMIRFVFPKYNLNHEANLDIARDCFFDNPKQVFFGKDVFVNRKCQFHVGIKKAKILIGNSVWIGMDCCFVCPSHEIGDNKQRAGNRLYNDIVVGDGVWIGARATILAGVTIGSGSVIAAGSVITKSVPPNELWGGVPGKMIRKLNN